MLQGEECEDAVAASYNYANCLNDMQRFQEAKELMRKTMPVARRVLGMSRELVLRIRLLYAHTLYQDSAATLDDLREAVTTLEELERTTRRVIGSSHPTTGAIEFNLQEARAALRARETPPDELDEVENA